MLLERAIASAAKWLEGDSSGLKVFEASRTLHGLRPSQTACEFLHMFKDDGTRLAFFEFGELPDGEGHPNGEGRHLLKAFKEGAWEALRTDFPERSFCVYATMTFHNRVSAKPQIRLESAGTFYELERNWAGDVVRSTALRLATLFFESFDLVVLKLRIRTPGLTSPLPVDNDYNVRVGGREVEMRLESSHSWGAFDEDHMTGWNVRLMFPCRPYCVALRVVTRPAVPAGPNHGLLLG